MCGIAGRVNLFSQKPVEPAAIEAMCGWIRHRGPDDQGVHVDGAVGLGHRRLAIIDLSPGGHQPMANATGRFWVVFNGEIYNYRELRQQLESKGHQFKTLSDTEVLLAAFEAYGTDCLPKLRGMFAFALWDTHTRRLVLARDRVGKKPLYYRRDGHGVAFASESKAFFADPGFEAHANLSAISAYLSLQYVPAPLSAFDGVSVLPPAHYLVASAEGVAVHRYWRLAYQPKSDLDEAEAEAALLDKLTEAVKLRLVADVPLGAFLSGGVDSSVVVALMATLGGHEGAVRTFSIGFAEQEFNELPYARAVAARYDTQHREFIVRPAIQDLLPRLVWHYGEPFADSSAVPTLCLSELTRQHVTVALNGDGGDENFAGYDRYAMNGRNAVYGALPQPIRTLAAQIASALPATDGTVGRLRTWVRRHGLAPDSKAAVERMLIDIEAKQRLCTPAFAAIGEDRALEHVREAFLAGDAEEPLDRLLSMDAETYLPGALLPKVDIATMAVGLEGRSPFLDHEVMEFAARLPVTHKRLGWDGKRLLKRLARRLVPHEIIDRPKRGFTLPLAGWFRHELADTLRDTLLGSAARRRAWIQPAAVERMVQQHKALTHDWNEQLWILLMLELWAQQFLDGRPRSTAAPSSAPVVDTDLIGSRH